MNYVLIKAGGKGERMQGIEIPKQFIKVDSIPIIIYTLLEFEKNIQIDGICVSCINGWEEFLRKEANKFNITKLKWIVEGGNTPQKSIDNGLKELSKVCNDDDIIIIHDAVRPLINQELINKSLENAKEYGASVVTAPCIETMLWSDEGIYCSKTYDRDKLFQSRAPQAYNCKKLLSAYSEAEKRGITNSLSTDELFITLEIPIVQIIGSVHNIKITTLDDIEMFEAIIMYRKIKR